MANISVDALVVGAGVCGLTTALCLARRGMSVRVVAQQLPPNTDSCAAGAMWGPFLVGHDDAERWAHETLATFRGLAADDSSGVSMISGVEAARERADPHPWLKLTEDLHLCPSQELPAGYVSGWRYTTAALDMPVYSQFLLREVMNAGGQLENRFVRSLRDLTDQAAVIVNCSGGGARILAQDESLTPVRGEVVIVENPGIEDFFAEVGEGPELTYFIPHGDRVVLGSTLEPVHTFRHRRPDAAERIKRRCAAIEPMLANAVVIDSRVGYRPVRPRIRLEYTTLDGRPVIHNYGHGGGGVSVSWGCANEVRAMVETLTSTLS